MAATAAIPNICFFKITSIGELAATTNSAAAVYPFMVRVAAFLWRAYALLLRVVYRFKYPLQTGPLVQNPLSA
jgi:hypothetical protein